MSQDSLEAARRGTADLRAGDINAPTSADISEEEAVRAENARYAAQTAHDVAAMQRLLGDDLVYVHAGGAVDDKSSFIDAQRSGALIYRMMERSAVTVRVFGSVAILTGRGHYDVTVNGEERAVDLLFHSIWVKRGGEIQFVSWHSTPVPAPVGAASSGQPRQGSSA